jgi:hypothetical protein
LRASWARALPTEIGRDDDPIITLNMFITDPKSVKYDKRVKAKKIANDLGIAIATVWSWIRSGALPASQPHARGKKGRLYFVHEQALDEFLRRHMTVTAIPGETVDPSGEASVACAWVKRSLCEFVMSSSTASRSAGSSSPSPTNAAAPRPVHSEKCPSIR